MTNTSILAVMSVLFHFASRPASVWHDVMHHLHHRANALGVGGQSRTNWMADCFLFTLIHLRFYLHIQQTWKNFDIELFHPSFIHFGVRKGVFDLIHIRAGILHGPERCSGHLHIMDRGCGPPLSHQNAWASCAYLHRLRGIVLNSLLLLSKTTK